MSETKSRLLDVGNCDPDHGMIRRMLTENFAVEIDRVMFVKEAIAKLRENRYDLVLFNRLIFTDYSEGIELLRQVKADAKMASTQVMMISNFKEAQEKSVAAGGVPGFGKDSIFKSTTIELLHQYLVPISKPSKASPAQR